MKKLLVCALVLAFIAGGWSAFAEGKVAGKAKDDLSSWGQSGATPAPVKDTGGSCGQASRSCYWWWPKEAKSNANDGELWGNRGVVYNCMVVPEKPKVVTPPPPVVPPVVKWVKPTFNNVLFDFDKAVLKPEGKTETDKVVAELKKNGKETLVIEGHTCDIGEEAYNMGLGQRRADAVAKYMVEQGIAKDRITAKSYGETKPAVKNDSAANRKLNRRAVFEVSIK